MEFRNIVIQILNSERKGSVLHNQKQLTKKRKIKKKNHGGKRYGMMLRNMHPIHGTK